MEGIINENDLTGASQLIDNSRESSYLQESEMLTSTIKMEQDQLSIDPNELKGDVDEKIEPVLPSQVIDIPKENFPDEKKVTLNSSDAEQDQSGEYVASDTNSQSKATSQKSQSKFEVDVDQIESVTVEDQDADIQSLGLTVYDQSALERGIWDQVERETRKREAQQELANVSSKLKLAEEQLKRVEATKGVKRSILQSALEEPARKKPNSTVLKKHQDVTQEKVKELRLKQAELQARLSNKVQTKSNEAAEESERDRKIRMGEMTPFGTTANAASRYVFNKCRVFLIICDLLAVFNPSFIFTAI